MPKAVDRRSTPARFLASSDTFAGAAQSAVPVDPILTAIEAHRAAWIRYDAAAAAAAEVDHKDEQCGVLTRECDEAQEAYAQASTALTTTPPLTLAGFAALATYGAEVYDPKYGGWPALADNAAYAENAGSWETVDDRFPVLLLRNLVGAPSIATAAADLEAQRGIVALFREWWALRLSEDGRDRTDDELDSHIDVMAELENKMLAAKPETAAELAMVIIANTFDHDFGLSGGVKQFCREVAFSAAGIVHSRQTPDVEA